MALDERIKLQVRFATLNIIWVLFGLGIVIFQMISAVKDISGMPLFLTISFVTVDCLLANFIKIKNEKKLICFGILRYLQIVVAILVMCYTIDDSFTFFIYAAMALFISMIEYFLLYDIFDSLHNSLCLITLILAMSFAPLMCSLLFKDIEKSLVFVFLFFANLTIASIYFSRMFIEYISAATQKIMQMNRLVDNVKEANEALYENQEKVKKANELLGVQKVKLESAYQKINNVNAEMMIQNQIISYIASSLELDKVMQLITESILEKMGVEVCAIVLYPTATYNSKVLYKVRTNMRDNYSQILINNIENYCFDPYIKEGQTYVDNHVTNRYDFLKDNLLGSILIVPFVKNNKVIGALYVGHSTYDYFYDNKAFYEAIVSRFMVALDNANLYKKMESMAIRDGLTGIYNRRFLTKLFQETIKNAVRNSQSVSVVLFDIDHFKRVNDTYGHVFGDVVIQTIAKLGWATAKDHGGVIGRYGGEEFVIIFPNKGVDASYNIIKEFHKKLKNTSLKHSSGMVNVDVSIGLTSYPETCKNPEELLSRADWAMYYSKKAGRGCITIDSDEVQKMINQT